VVESEQSAWLTLLPGERESGWGNRVSHCVMSSSAGRDGVAILVSAAGAVLLLSAGIRYELTSICSVSAVPGPRGRV
jgi:hypothetical protein